MLCIKLREPLPSMWAGTRGETPARMRGDVMPNPDVVFELGINRDIQIDDDDLSAIQNLQSLRMPQGAPRRAAMCSWTWSGDSR